MAGKPIKFSQIKDLLRMRKSGTGHKKIANTLGISKNTVKSYLDRLTSTEIDMLLSMDDRALECRFHAGNPSYKDKRYVYLESRLEHYVSELSRGSISKYQLWQDYRQECVHAGYASYACTQFVHHLNQLLEARDFSLTEALTYCPGEKLFVDYRDDWLGYIDRDTGEIIQCSVFVACLAFSGYCFASVSNKSIDAFKEALIACMTHFGGIPCVMSACNIKAVEKREFYDFANRYDIVALTENATSPFEKNYTENQLKLLSCLVYSRLRKVQFSDMGSLCDAVAQNVRKHNQTRTQQRAYCRQELFLAQERSALRKLPDIQFYLPTCTDNA